MPEQPIVVRALEGQAEVQHFFRLSATAFGPADRVGVVAGDWQRLVTADPTFAPEQLRGAFRGETLLAGYTLFQRPLAVHGVMLRTACVGAVVTDPAYRNQGAARALMADSVAQARRGGCALLLLHGEVALYDRFGYANVFGRSEFAFDRRQLLALPAGPASVRPATPADAAAWRELYQWHYGGERSVAQQAHLISWMEQLAPRDPATLDQYPPVVAIGPDGALRGYLQFTWAPLRVFGCEAAAADWEAAAALLRYHATCYDDHPEPPAEIRWGLPPASPTLDLIGDHLPLRGELWSGWMARPVDLDRLIAALIPLWRARWLTSNRPWRGTLGLQIGEQRWHIALGDGLGLAAAADAPADAQATVDAKVFTQLIFGHRPASWAAQQPGSAVDPELIAVLAALCPRGEIALAPSAAF